MNLKSNLCVKLTASFNLDKTYFRCSITTCGWPLAISLVKIIQKHLEKLINKLHLVDKKIVHREIT